MASPGYAAIVKELPCISSCISVARASKLQVAASQNSHLSYLSETLVPDAGQVANKQSATNIIILPAIQMPEAQCLDLAWSTPSQLDLQHVPSAYSAVQTNTMHQEEASQYQKNAIGVTSPFSL